MFVYKALSWLASRSGYNLIKGSEYDKLKYIASHKPQQKINYATTAIDMKKKLLQNVLNPVIFDVGAYVGKTVAEYITAFPRASVIAFEPTPTSYSELSRAYKNNLNVRCVQAAITDRVGKIKFHLNEFSPTNSSLTSSKDAYQYWGESLLSTTSEIAVQSITLDEYCDREAVKNIDLLKLDVQGAELRVLNGATNLLSQKRIGVIYLEVIFVPTYKEQSTYFEVGKFLDDHGYKLCGFFNLSYDEQIKQADLIYSKG